MRHFKNSPNFQDTDPILNSKLFEEAYQSIKNWPDYMPTPLYHLNGLASELGVGTIFYKDESQRFGLKSFKALGGAYAVVRVLKEHLTMILKENDIRESDILNGKYATHFKNFTVATATDGNHGRSVAWGAQKCGINCVIYMHKGVSESRAIAVELLGAKVVWVDGNYDDSLHKVKRDAIENQWHIISDTSYDGYTYIPKFVMAGYTVMTWEIIEQLKNDPIPSHIIIQGGVGGLAGAICAHAAKIWGSNRPKFIIVEPETADCLYQSAKAGEPKMVHIEQETMMGGLSCGEVSIIGWDILKNNADHFVTISDNNVKNAMCLLALGVGDDPSVEAGESAVAGIAMLMELAKNSALKEALSLDENSRILLFGTEGATDQKIYDEIISGN
ncbi:MAG: diaminopropionate ammonia-lyase [Alphaproteobacteria bacterium]|nr:diaminopropionate ammonia-lyase [Alphaproteobacteria bacterium]